MDAASPLRGRPCTRRGTGVPNAAALPPPRLHLVGFGVGREDGGHQSRHVQLACYTIKYLWYQQTKCIGPNCCAVWPNHVRLVANHMVSWLYIGVSENETAEPAEDHTLSLERATSTRRTHGRNSGLRHHLRTHIQSPSKAQRYPIENSDGWAWMSG